MDFCHPGLRARPPKGDALLTFLECGRTPPSSRLYSQFPITSVWLVTTSNRNDTGTDDKSNDRGRKHGSDGNSRRGNTHANNRDTRRTPSAMPLPDSREPERRILLFPK